MIIIIKLDLCSKIITPCRKNNPVQRIISVLTRLEWYLMLKINREIVDKRVKELKFVLRKYSAIKRKTPTNNNLIKNGKISNQIGFLYYKKVQTEKILKLFP